MEPRYPGVWIGSWEIQTIGGLGLFGARHTAVCCVDRQGGRAVTELVGWVESFLNDIQTRPWPHYGHFSNYRWVQVAPVTAIPRVVEAIARARLKFTGLPYSVSNSNRFVGWVIAYAHIRLTSYELVSIGSAPGLIDFPDG